MYLSQVNVEHELPISTMRINRKLMTFVSFRMLMERITEDLCFWTLHGLYCTSYARGARGAILQICFIYGVDSRFSIFQVRSTKYEYKYRHS